MADAIGQLGLDTKDIEDALGRVSNKLTNMAMSARGAGASIVQIAAGAAMLAEGIYKASVRATELGKALNNLQKTDPLGASLLSATDLSSRLKDIQTQIDKINTKGFIDVFFDAASGKAGSRNEEEGRALNQLLKERQNTLDAIARKEGDNLKLLEMQIDGNTEEDALLKNHLAFKEKIYAATKEGNTQLAVTLKKEEAITAELIKQKAIKEGKEATSKIAEDQAKGAIDSLLGDQKNQQTIDDREADRQQKEIEDTQDFNDKQAQEFRNHQEKLLEDTKNANDKQAQEFRNFKEKEGQDKLDFEEKQKQDFLRSQANKHEELKQLSQKNSRDLDTLSAETESMQLNRSGRSKDAALQNVRNSFRQKIMDANRNHNDDAARELGTQESIAEEQAKADIFRQSSASKRAERNEANKVSRDAAKLDKQDAENNERFSRGARSRAIDESLERRANKARQGNEIADAKKQDAKSANWTDQDAKNLADIAKSFNEP